MLRRPHGAAAPRGRLNIIIIMQLHREDVPTVQLHPGAATEGCPRCLSDGSWKPAITTVWFKAAVSSMCIINNI